MLIVWGLLILINKFTPANIDNIVNNAGYLWMTIFGISVIITVIITIAGKIEYNVSVKNCQEKRAEKVNYYTKIAVSIESSGESFYNEFSFLKFAHSLLQYDYPNDNFKRAFFVFLYDNMKRGNLYLLPEFGKIIFGDNIPADISDNEIDSSFRLLRKRYKKTLSPRITYKYFAMLALIYVFILNDIDYDVTIILNCYKKLKINKKQRQILEGYIKTLHSAKLPDLTAYFQNTQLKKIATTIEHLSKFANNEFNFYCLPRRNISVFSTMSAGKSTFINALLGSDYLPSRNEPTTAQITAIANTDYIDYCLGCAVKSGNRIFSGKVDNTIIDVWNSDGEVSGIILEGNLDRINSEKSISVIHDTPGINYSGNPEHKKITLDHLVVSESDIIICLMDATEMFIHDFSVALDNLKRTNEEGSKAEIIFVVNKADCYDPQKESLKKTLDETVEILKERGFDVPVIIPVSSRAARLFKMALRGKEERFTENETDDFARYVRFFSQPENFFNHLAIGIPDTLLYYTEYETMEKAEISIDGKTYERREINRALFNTGIPVIENFLNTQKETR
jgi:ribosome biogenesis GTPase A